MHLPSAIYQDPSAPLKGGIASGFGVLNVVYLILQRRDCYCTEILFTAQLLFAAFKTVLFG